MEIGVKSLIPYPSLREKEVISLLVCRADNTLIGQLVTLLTFKILEIAPYYPSIQQSALLKPLWNGEVELLEPA